MTGSAAADSAPGLDAALRSGVRAGLVDYAVIGRDERFERYLRSIERAEVGPGRTRTDRLAFWINAYNALSIKSILDGRSPGSLLGRFAFFKLASHDVAGRRLTLDAIEHEILIPLGEPRVHFALVCAAWSCPPLRAGAYGAESLGADLDDQARLFINDRLRNRFDRAEKTAYLSRIFDWYADEFEAAAGSVAAYVARYVDEPALARALAAGEYAVRYLEYDWNLNRAPP